jgi:hypothetical protein
VGATGPAAAIDPDGLRTAGPVKVDPYVGGQRFATPSGKLEFYSTWLEKQGLPPMPDWHDDARETAQASRWPLRLLTAPGYFQSHTAFSGNGALRRREGVPVAILHPADAARRGLRAGERVELHNDLGVFGARLQVSQRDGLGDGEPPVRRPPLRSRRGRDLPEHVPRRPPRRLIPAAIRAPGSAVRSPSGRTRLARARRWGLSGGPPSDRPDPEPHAREAPCAGSGR